MATVPQKPEKPKLPDFPQIEDSKPNTEKVEILINYIDTVRTYLEEVKEYITKQEGQEKKAEAEAVAATGKDGDEEDAAKIKAEKDALRYDQAGPRGRGTPVPIEDVPGGGKKKQRKTKKKGGADIDYSKVYNVQGLIENISKSTGKDPIASQSVPAPFSTGSPLQRFGKKEAKSLPNELKNEIIPDYSQDGGKKKKTEKKKMPKKK